MLTFEVKSTLYPLMKRIFILLFLALPGLGFCQSDFKDGYIITPANDTLRGLVDYRENQRANESCVFKQSTGSIITYSPGQIAGYGFVNDKFYLSKFDSEAGMVDTVFMEVLVKGPVSLYKTHKTFWLEKDGPRLYHLVDVVTESYVNGAKVLRHSNAHISIFNMLLFDCVEMRSSLSQVRLNEPTLTKIIQRYNTCMGGTQQIFKEKKPWIKVSAGLSAGINISKLHLTTPTEYQYRHLTGTYERWQSPIFGISFGLMSPRVSERFSFTGGVLYNATKYNHFEMRYTTRTYIIIDLRQLKIPLGFRYTFPERKLTPFLNMGVSSTMYLKSNSRWIEESGSSAVITTTSKEALLLNSGQLGLWAGGGIIKPINKRLSATCDVKLEYTNGIASTAKFAPDILSTVMNLQVIFGIRIK
jgi:hypothetical protein